MELTVVGKERLPSRGCDLKNMYIFIPNCLINCDPSSVFLHIFPIFSRDLNYNNLGEFPQAIKALPSLKELWVLLSSLYALTSLELTI